MKTTLILSLMLAVPALAGPSQDMTGSPPPPPDQDLWSWFAGASGGYLFDFDEDIYTFQIGADSPWSAGEWRVAFFGEVGWTENHDDVLRPAIPGGFADANVDIVPLIFNVKLTYPISNELSAYVGGGLGVSYADTEVTSPFPGFNESGDDWVFTSQIFAGLSYQVNESFEVFTGLRWIYFDDTDINDVSLGDDLMIEGGLRYHF